MSAEILLQITTNSWHTLGDILGVPYWCLSEPAFYNFYPQSGERSVVMNDMGKMDSGDSSTHTLVIGAGFGGIAAALRMRAKGHRVTLVERLDAIGGRAQAFEQGGFRHDAGPTVITAPFLFDELFALFGEKREDYLDFRPLDPWYRFHFHDGSEFDYRPSLEDTHAEIARFLPEDTKNYDRLIQTSKDIFDIGFSELADKPFTRFRAMLKQIPQLLRLKSYMTVAQLVNSHIKHPLLQQAFSIHPLLVGGNPFDTTSIYALIHYLERKWGVYFCMGGTGKLVAELEALMRRQGIDIRLDADIEEILVQGERVVGVHTQDGTEIHADRIICNGDHPLFMLKCCQPIRAGAKNPARQDDPLFHGAICIILW